MNRSMTLLIPEKTDNEFEQIVATWTNKGGHIKRLGKYWIRDEELAKQQIAIYGNQTFSLVLAQIYHVELLSPDDTVISRLANKWTKRNIQLKQMGQIAESDFPVFIKPVIPKIFLAGIYQTMSDFKVITQGLQGEEEILISSIIDPIQAEARSYIMDGVVKDIALYEGLADLESGRSFVTEFIGDNVNQLPRVVVLTLHLIMKLVGSYLNLMLVGVRALIIAKRKI